MTRNQFNFSGGFMMRRKRLMLSVFLVCSMFASLLNAQSAVETQEAPKEPVKVSGVMFLQWLKEIERPSDGESRNGFDIQRVYLNFSYKIDAIWSTRATLDVGNDNGNDQRYQAYLKYGYIQVAPDFGFGKLTVQFGMIGTLVINLIDTYSDCRWLNENFINASNIILHNQKSDKNGQLTGRTPIATGWSGQSIDTSADLGVGANLKLAKMVSFDVQITNGEGYKKTNDISGNDDGKAYLALLSITPLEGLCIAGYMRHLVTNDSEAGDNYNRYYGLSLLYTFHDIHTGASFVMAEVSTATPPATDQTIAKYRLFDAFVMANLKSLTGVPVLLAARYVVGFTRYDEGYAGANGAEAHARVWAVGAGYQFNNFVRAMLYLEDQHSYSDDIAIAEWEHPARNAWLKVETKF